MNEDVQQELDAHSDPILAPLNEPQRMAVTHADGPLLVVAGPGSGKTRVITHRIAHLVRSGVPPTGILAITFTNKAAAEMRGRVERLLEMTTPWISTFHSFAARVLRRHIHRLPPFTSSFTIYDAEDTLALIKECVKSLDVSTSILTPRALRSAISRLKNRGVEDPEAMPPRADLLERVTRQVFARYVRELRERNALDFDDLLLFLVRLLETQEDVLDYYRRQFRHVLIDEYQDTNQVQYRIGNLIASEHRNLCVTGDPDQSIYSWRGADIRNILTFERDYPDARVVKLEQNYRSTGAILHAANAVISNNTERKEKRLWTENEQGDPVRVYRFADSEAEAFEIAALIDQFRSEGVPAGRIAVFYRINALSRELEQALVRRGIPYVIVGAVEFFERREIKDLLAYLRIVANPRDVEALRRVINVPPRGIGKATLDRVLETAAGAGLSALDVILDPSTRTGFSARMGKALGQFAGDYRTIAALERKPVADFLRTVFTETRYGDYLKTLGDEEAVERTANVEELVNAAAQYDARQPDGDVAGFLQEVALFTPVDRWEQISDRVTLMTLHSAKGLEFPVVILCGVEEGLLPLQRADADSQIDLEEERRLFFVGLTRAMLKLYVTHAARRMRFGREVASTCSLFVAELALAEDEENILLDHETRRALDRQLGAVDTFEWDVDVEREVEWDEDVEGNAAAADWDDEDVGEDPFPDGARVFHERYGEGTVTRSTGRGPDRRLTIEFDSVGVKHIVLGFARIERL